MGGYVSIDDNNPERNTLFMGIAGLGLPDRDYYLVDNERNEEIRSKYIDLLTYFLGKAGYEDPASAAAAVYAFEHQIAERDWDRGVGRNPIITNNVETPAALAAMSGKFPLMAFFDEWGVADVDSLIVAEILPDAEEQKVAGVSPADMAKLGGGFPAVMQLLGEAPLATIQAWMAAQFLIGNAAFLSSELDEKQFDFYGKVLSGTEQQRPRWQRAVSLVEGSMGEAIGEIYVEEHFPPESKAAMDELVPSSTAPSISSPPAAMRCAPMTATNALFRICRPGAGARAMARWRRRTG
jgi:putative endopeptidase